MSQERQIVAGPEGPDGYSDHKPKRLSPQQRRIHQVEFRGPQDIALVSTQKASTTREKDPCPYRDRGAAASRSNSG